MEQTVSLVDYKPEYGPAFRALNEAWISLHFQMEAADYEALDNPEEKIIAPGGAIVVALLGNTPVGVCALMRHGDEWELAKMAVDPAARGKNIGYALGIAIVGKARKAGARVLFLESNTSLTPAINLYLKLGFREVPLAPSPYQRADIRMELVLTD